MQCAFARFDIPEIIYSDNGPQFRSREFQEFMKKWDIVHQTSSPYYPQSNGMAEIAVKIAKKIVVKAQGNEEEISQSLLAHRNTPLGSVWTRRLALMLAILLTK